MIRPSCRFERLARGLCKRGRESGVFGLKRAKVSKALKALNISGRNPC